MEILIAMCLILSGIYTTTTIVLLLSYWKMLKSFSKNKQTLADTSAKIATEHNAMAERLIIIQEAVNNHEFKLNGASLSFFNKK